MPRISLWRTPRARSLLLLGTLGGLAAVVVLGANLYTELLWFRELGQESVFWTTLKWKVLTYGVVGLGSASFLILNFAIVERAAARDARAGPAHPVLAALWRFRRLLWPAVAIVCGWTNSKLYADGAWQLVLLWAKRSNFGVTDPLFHRDVGYFIFSLPLYQRVADWLTVLILTAVAATTVAYASSGGLRLTRPFLISRRTQRHLFALTALLLLVLAWRSRLHQFSLALPHAGASLPGATYTDVRVRLPLLRIMGGVVLVGAGLSMYAAWRRVLVHATIALAAIGALAVGAERVLPPLIDHFDVQPQTLPREKPYLSDSIAATRQAFGLDKVSVEQLSGNRPLTRSDIAESRRTLDNIPLWDSEVLRPAMNDLQAIGRYYSFPDTTVDRYRVHGVPRVMTIGAREVDPRRLEPEARSWTNERFAYTHGYGLAAVRAGDVTGGGLPRFVHQDFRSAGNPLRLTQPRIYYGERPKTDPPFLVVNSHRGEIDEPSPGGSPPPSYHYGGTGGISISNPLRRIAFATRFGDLKLLLSQTVTGGSRILLHRDVHDRLERIAPFLKWDSRPETTVMDGRVQYLFHGYTTSTDYPYASRLKMGRGRVNYMRDAAQASIDAFTGQVKIYARDTDDPIVRAWERAYPTLFLPASLMPREMRRHLRYPEPLFKLQARAYETYHATDVTAFWNSTDAWQRPRQLAGSAEQAGEIHFPDAEGAPPAEPQYLLVRLPGQTRERFVMATPFTPRGQENLVGYLAGWIDREGHPRLRVLSLPRDRQTIGPAQATRQMLVNPAVTRRLELLNRESRDLGRAAVARTVLGVPMLVPVGETFIHVQPVYLSAGGSGLPRLQLVTVLVNGRVGYGPSVRAALRKALG